MIISEGAKEVLKKLKNLGYEAYVVGGAVRNYFLSLPAEDYDFTTSATPDEVLEAFKGYNTFAPGLKHGTVCVEIDKKVYEITTFRHEEKYVDNRHPEKVTFVRSLNEDLSRRDFTVNAICFDGQSFVDLFYGREDINNKLLRAIGNPEERFDEDALRILRALRFASKFGFRIEENTKKAIFSRKRLLNNISAERIRVEFDGIILGEHCESVLMEYREVISEFIPEIRKSFDFLQHSKYHSLDVYAHSVKACAVSKSALEVRLASFLHDVAKPECFSIDEKGMGHFYGHYKRSAVIAEAILERLKYSNDIKREVVRLIEHHEYPFMPNGIVEDKYVLRALSRFGETTLRNLIDLQRADNSAKTQAVYDNSLPKLKAVEERLDGLISKQACFSLKQLAVDGSLVKSLGFRGREIGAVLNFLLDKVMAGERNEKEHLVSLIKENFKIG